MRLFIILFLLLISCKSSKDPYTNSKINEKKVEINYISDTSKNLVNNIDSNKFETYSILKESDFKNENESIRFIKKKKEDIIKKYNLSVYDYTNDNIYLDTTRGWIAYSVPDIMKVDFKYSIKLRITKEKNQKSKSILILGDRDIPISESDVNKIAKIEDIKVGNQMIAELKSDNSFDIYLLSSEKQLIDSLGYTEWEWLVIPRKSGNNYLRMLVKIEGLDKDLMVFNKNIKVKSNVPVVIESWLDKYWQWIMTTIVIPLVIYFWNRKRKRNKK